MADIKFSKLEKALILDAKREQKLEVPSLEAIQILFPEWQEGNEKVVFVCGHEDDAIAGSGMLINYLTKTYGADVHLLVLTNASNGFSPNQILWEYKDIFDGIRKNIGIFDKSTRGISVEDFILRMEKEPEFKIKVCDTIKTRNNEDLRKKEALNAYSMIGVPRRNINYFTYNGRTIDDLCITPYDCLTMPDGKTGIWKWMIEELRNIGATRVLAINPGDPHKDHRDASKLGVDVSKRAISNLPHLGRGASIKNNSEGTHGLYYLIYDNMPPEMGTKAGEKLIHVPQFAIMGTEEDAELKYKALSEFKSQPRLAPLYKDMLKIGNAEFFHPFPSLNNTITAESGYHSHFLELAQRKGEKQ